MKNKLTKAEIVNNIYSVVSQEAYPKFTRTDVQDVVELFFEEIKKGLSEDRIIELRGFGTFETRVRKGKDYARNPKTGESVSVEEHCTAVFRPGRELKQKVWDVKGQNK
ncbi:MAG: integration host factor subunit beta [Spirochaetales bacterium]|nr:integration host factor subunit beta [Spirochaetales bacterium]